ncbi:MAG TPA: hypothetical protein VN521_07770, partial [Negativicutes bacterium]|nr:hypothetical protein [Negativicutes bacterium]
AYTVEQYRRSSLAALAKARSYPSLADLATLKGWQDASAKHGKTPVSLTILLASLYIADKHGPAAFAVWFKAVKETGRAETAFEKTFGIPIAQFSDEFSAYLNSVR